MYIGEADSVADRIRAHVRDESKDFWTRACFITSKDTNLTKAHARYIESRLIELARSPDRANLANGNDPAAKPLPESDIADMEFFLTQVQVVLPVVGLDFLRQSPTPIAHTAQVSTDVRVGPVPLHLKSDSHGIEARALESDGEITVLKGSGATVKTDYVTNTYAYASLRKQLVDEGRLRLSPAGDKYEFADDIVFNSPSAAAAVIFNRNTNGRTAWKVTGPEITLKEWQDAQVAEVGKE